MEEDIGREVRRDIVRTGKGVARTIVYEFLVELLGALIPGVIFTAIMAFFLVSLCNLVETAWSPSSETVSAEESIQNLSSMKLSADGLEIEEHENPSSVSTQKGALSILGNLNLQMTLLFLVVAYVIGHFFFRKPPKEPDTESAKRIWKKSVRAGEINPHPQEPPTVVSDAQTGRKPGSEHEEYPFPLKLTCTRLKKCSKERCPFAKEAQEEKNGFFSRLKRLRSNWRCYVRKCQVEGKIEFPYSHLSEYLTQRGLEHLANLIPWEGKRIEGGDEKHRDFRTKLFINFLKVRLQSVLPDWYHVLARNEAHVRLMSSTWYMARALKCGGVVLAILSFMILLVKPEGSREFLNLLFSKPDGLQEFPALLFSEPDGPQEFLSLLLTKIDGPLSVLMGPQNLGATMLFLRSVILIIFMKLAQYTIENFLFYQRIREVTQVLETAYYAHIMDPNLRIFEGLGIDAPLRKDF